MVAIRWLISMTGGYMGPETKAEAKGALAMIIEDNLLSALDVPGAQESLGLSRKDASLLSGIFAARLLADERFMDCLLAMPNAGDD
jgi:hypothetical protein